MKKLFKVIGNKYFLVSLAFLIYLTFFSPNNLLNQVEATRTLRALDKEKNFYISQTEKDRELIKTLKTDTAALEKFGREKYLMKKDNEDIYLITEEKKE